MLKKLTFFSFLLLFIVFSSKVNADEIQYQNQIDNSTFHDYKLIVTSSGTLQIENLLPNNSDVYWYLINLETGEEYISGEVLPVGTYRFVVGSIGESLTDYHYKISGIGISSESKVSLPQLSLTSPSSFYTRLANGITSILVSGSSSTANTILNHYKLEQMLGQNFSTNLSLLFGSNTFSVTSLDNNGNNVKKIREVVSPGVKRLEGANRSETSVSVSMELDKFGLYNDKIIILNSTAEVDGVPATVLSVKEKAPILLSEKDYLPDSVINEINRLNPSSAIIIGNQNAISDNVVNKLRDLGVENINRIYGSTRVETSIDIAEQIIENDNTTAIIVNGFATADGVIGAAFGAKNRFPVLYINSDNSLPTSVQNFLALNPQISSFVVIGSAAYDETLLNQLSNYGGVETVKGIDRYDTSVQMASFQRFEDKSYIIANAEYSFIDGVIGSTLAGARNYTLLFTRASYLPSYVENYLVEKYNKDGIDNIYIMGSTMVVSPSVEDQLKGLVN